MALEVLKDVADCGEAQRKTPLQREQGYHPVFKECYNMARTKDTK